MIGREGMRTRGTKGKGLARRVMALAMIEEGRTIIIRVGTRESRISNRGRLI